MQAIKFLNESSRTFLVIELLHTGKGKKPGLTVVLSLPGREGTSSRHWSAPYGILDEGQLRDLAAFVGKVAVDGVVAFAGAQRTLPVE